MADPVTSAKTTEKSSAGSKGQSGETKRKSRLSDDGWEGFGGYMNAKKLKLDEQFNKEKQVWSSKIFAGVAVYVNGYTNPSSDELRRILQQNGGRYEVYLRKTRVTHIVATSLPNSKYHLAKTIPIVRPEWITDSAAAGKRLSHSPYLLIGNKSKLQTGLRTLPPRTDKIDESQDSKFRSCSPSCSLPKDELENVDAVEFKQSMKRDILSLHEDSTADNVCSEKLSTENTAVKVTNNIMSFEPVLDTSDTVKIDVNISHSNTTLTRDDNVIVDDDDDDIVYNSEEEDDDQKNRTSSKALIFQSAASPYKRSRVYSLRKFRKSNSGSFEVSGIDGTNSCDGFIESSKLDLLDSGGALNQKVMCSTPIEHLKDLGQASDYLLSNEGQTLDAVFEHKNDGKIKPVYSLDKNTEVSNVKSNMADKPRLQVNSPALSSEGSSFVLASDYVSSLNSQHETVASDSLNIHQCILNSSSGIQNTFSKPLQPLFSSSVCEKKHPISEARSLLQNSDECSISRSFSTSGTSPFSKSEPKNAASKQTTQRTSSSTMAKASDKNFLSEFYSNSRLHHIATWGAEFKAYVAEIQRSCSHVYPGRDKLRQSHVENAMKVGQPEILSSARYDTLKKVVMHIDMDCFFVSVGLLARPDLKGKPVAVTHSRGQGVKPNSDSNLEWERAEWKKKLNKNLKVTKIVETEDIDDTLEALGESVSESYQVPVGSAGAQTFHSMAEIASCSYEARKVGVKNGMFMGTAVKLCPDLQTIPYNFAEYNHISRILYDVVASYTSDIEAVSCDEMLIDCTDLLSDTGATAMEFAQVLRAEMLEKTGCSASAGIGPNILLARLATRRAKPNGQFEVTAAEAKEFIKNQLVSDLPGVGYSMSRKLALLGVHVCGDLQNIPLSALKQEFGPKTGEMLHGFSLGQDSREIKGDKQRKSVSAEVNYGIRFTKDPEAVTFLQDLSLEVKRRLDAIGVKGRSITLKLMVRRSDAPIETAKFMGHGICNTFNKSSNLPLATNDEKVIAREVVSLYRAQRVVAADVRGIGIQINKLEKAEKGGGMSSGHHTLGHQSILSFAVPKTSSSIISADSVVMTIVATSANVAITNSRTVLKSSCVTRLSSDSVNVPQGSFTSLKNSRDERVMGSKTDNAESTNNLKASCAGSSSARRTAHEVGSAVDKSNIQQNSNLSVTGADGHKINQISARLFGSEDKNSLVYDDNFGRLIQNADLATSSESSIVKHAINLNPSWQCDAPRPGTSREVEGAGDASFLTESQIDSNVLQELPSDVAEEILEDLRRRKQQKQHSSCSLSDSPVFFSDVAGVYGSTSSVSSKHVRGAAFHESLPSLSQLDLSCFSALPFHLQQELRAAYAREEETTQRSVDKMAALSDKSTFTRLRSPSKNIRGKQSGAVLKNPKHVSKNVRSKGKKLLIFGSRKVKDGRSSNVIKKSGSTRTASAYSDVIICDEDDEDTNDSRGRCADDDSNDFKGVPGATYPFSNSEVTAEHLKLGNIAKKGQGDKFMEEVTFCGARSLDDVRKLMKEWLACCPEPQDDDVAMVTEYLIKLVQQRNLEQVFCLLKFLTRRSLAQNSPQWKECLFNISTCVQNVVCGYYGATFKL